MLSKPEEKPILLKKAPARISAAFKAVMADMTLFQGVKLTELLDFAYEQGKREAFKLVSAKVREAEKLGQQRKRRKRKVRK
jgi:hypothetical protein